MIPKNLIVETYRHDKSRSYILEKHIDNVRKELYRLVGQLDPEPIVQFLLEQRSNPDLFPNVIIFLDKDGKQMGMEEYVKVHSKRSDQ